MSESTPLLGRVHSVETFGLVDGPGVRYVIFLQGCAMRCQYCHNPETWDCALGEPQTPQQALQKALRYKVYWKNNGGLTVSGGEPLLQLDFTAELFRLAKQKGVHTALDTAGQPYREDGDRHRRFEALAENTDLFILDLKTLDGARHRALTGCDNANILAMARWLGAHGKALWIRHVLVPGLTDDEAELRDMADFIESLGTVRRVEILPYHTLGLYKWEKLKIPYPLEGVDPPAPEAARRAEELLRVWAYPDATEEQKRLRPE